MDFENHKAMRANINMITNLVNPLKILNVLSSLSNIVSLRNAKSSIRNGANPTHPEMISFTISLKLPLIKNTNKLSTEIIAEEI